MVSEFIIKARFGNSRRRFCVPINENNQMDIKMVDLRAKICSLFNFTADAKFVMSYVDVNFKTVNLVDDEDLKDVMRQQMRFLKLNVYGNGMLPLEASQWRNTIYKSVSKIVQNDDIICYASAFVAWAGLCSAIIFSKPKAQPPPIIKIENITKGGWFGR